MFRTAKSKDKLIQRQKTQGKDKDKTKDKDKNERQGQRQTISVEVVENSHASLFLSSLAVFSVIGLGDPVPGR